MISKRKVRQLASIALLICLMFALVLILVVLITRKEPDYNITVSDAKYYWNSQETEKEINLNKAEECNIIIADNNTGEIVKKISMPLCESCNFTIGNSGTKEWHMFFAIELPNINFEELKCIINEKEVGLRYDAYIPAGEAVDFSVEFDIR